MGTFLDIFAITGSFKTLFQHATGRMTDDEKDSSPKSEFARVYVTALIWLAIDAAVIIFAIATAILDSIPGPDA